MNRMVLPLATIAAAVACIALGHTGFAVFFCVMFVLTVA